MTKKRPFLTGGRLAKSDLWKDEGNTRVDHKAKTDTPNQKSNPFENIWDPNILAGEEENKDTLRKSDGETNEAKKKILPKLGHAREFILNLDFENDFEVDKLSDSKLDEKSKNRKKALGGKFENRITSVKLA